MKSIKIECSPCGGTGLYKGFMEAEGEAVICTRCSGTGANEFRYNEFTGRKEKGNVRKVRSASGYIIDNPSTPKWISYEEFKRRIPSPK